MRVFSYVINANDISTTETKDTLQSRIERVFSQKRIEAATKIKDLYWLKFSRTRNNWEAYIHLQSTEVIYDVIVMDVKNFLKRKHHHVKMQCQVKDECKFIKPRSL